ncbi:MAG: Hsp20/alpha crystallin family protein, partial [Candidatus Aminicenantaceae bacterium]
SFRRSFSLPHYIDQESIQAEHDNGVLKIRMNKKSESKPKNIKILKAKSKENKK